MLIINADDWGRSAAETDASFSCYQRGAISSVSAMVFMEDSKRAARLSQEKQVKTGLHLNLTDKFTANNVPAEVRESQSQISRFLRSSSLSCALYNPFLTRQFREVCLAQFEEFVRLYGAEPPHIDGHKHVHLCTNVLFGRLLPAGQHVRRNFSFWPGQKSRANVAYRRFIDNYLSGRYRLHDYFFDLADHLAEDDFARIVALARTATVELETHPVRTEEYNFLMRLNSKSGEVARTAAWLRHINNLARGSHPSLRNDS